MMNKMKYRAWCNIVCHTLVPKEPLGTGSDWISKFEMCEVTTLHFKNNGARVQYKNEYGGKETDNITFSSENILLEYTKVDDNQGNPIYDLDIIEITATIKSRYDKGEKFIVFYDEIHNRFGACIAENYGALHTGFRSHFFITPSNAKKFKVVGNMLSAGLSKTTNRSFP